MARPKSTPKKLTEEERLERDEELMTKLRISHHSDTTSESWPSHLKNTFHQIDALGQFRYEYYGDDTPAQHSTANWRRETKLRAKELSDTARRLLGNKSSELTWRLELEGLVDARFRLRTECETCSGPDRSGRQWRSEIEVVSEVEGIISRDLKARQEKRVPCRCLNAGYSGLNPLFSNRADQVFSYGPHIEKEVEENGTLNGPKNKGAKLPERRPDRVYGLRQTSNFEERLGSPAKTVLDGASGDAITALLGAVDAGDELLVQDFIHATPFHQRGDPLLFPFLILEAKSEEGRGHRNCGVQTSLPIWALLKAQERLRDCSDNLEEVGGPFIWYVHYLGDSWRVSGCYTTIEKGKRVYRIQDLWNGRISSPDGALRVLLIMDYIFDWARDLYRPSILLCLRAMSCSLDDSMSLAADSDINSTRKTFRQEEIMEMESISDSEFLEASASDESLLDPWKNFDIKEPRTPTDWNSLAFRPSYIIKSSFQCLYLTRDNMKSFIDCLGESHLRLEKMARDALTAIRSGPLIVTERILSQIESAWTGTLRDNRRVAAGGELFCSVVHAVSISPKTWELTRTIFCLAVDRDALCNIRKHAAFKRKTFLLEGIEEITPVLDSESAACFVQQLRNRNSQDILASAFSQICHVWKPLRMLNREEQKQLGHKFKGKIVLQPLVSGSYHIKNVVQQIYNRHKAGGRLVPDAPCLRFSAQLERLDKHIPIDDNSITLPLKSRQRIPEIPDNGMILVYDKMRTDRHLCIYILREYDNFPQLDDLTLALATVLSEERFFALNHATWVKNQNVAAFGIWDPKMRPGDKVMPLLKVAAQRWGEDLLKKFDKDFEQIALPEAFNYSKESYRELRKLFYDCPLSCDPELTRFQKKLRLAPLNWQKPKLYQRGTQLSTARIEEQNAEVQALFEKMGRTCFQNAVFDVLTKSSH